MKYRWGFIDENEAFIECKPILDNSTAIDYTQEAEQVFYRAKLNGELDFRFEFDYILEKGFNYTHRVVLQWYDADADEWKNVWMGRFTLTDCTIDYDSNTISVTPETIDRYTKILEDWEKEYNLIKLAPEIQPVNILIRPLLQVYEILDDKISNYVGNNYWESTCTPVERNDIDNYKFGYQKQFISAIITYDENAYSDGVYDYRNGKTITYVGEVIYGGFPQESTRVTGQYWDGGQMQTDTLRVRVAQMTEYTDFLFYGKPDVSGENQQLLFQANYIAYGMGTAADIENVYSAIVADAKSQWDMLCARFLVQTDQDTIDIDGTTYQLEEIPSNDMAGGNLNYNKVFYAPVMDIIISSEWSEEPTQWGKNYNETYFKKPTDILPSRWIPVGQSLWRYLSIWYRIPYVERMRTINTELTAERTIADSYRLDKATMKLLEKAGWNGQYWISRALGGNNDYVGDSAFIPAITAKSNVISSYYNTPAQNAPISLAKVFSMLRQAYRIYWYIDDNNNIHVEHISFFDNGYAYTESAPTVLIDLDSVLHTNTKESKDYCQNKVTFDKEGMADQFSFGWADQQTKPFDGYPINCLDAYVNKGVQQNESIGSFDSDVDFVLSSPSDVSKEGFFLFACPVVEGTIDWSLIVEDMRLVDEDGNVYNAQIQNADAAFAKIHKSWWRYALPCENINVNNENTTAITTGKYKLQAVEFADLAMAEVLKNIDNCNLVIRTQQGDGHIKSLSINLNSLTAKVDLLFNFVGRWFYLKGTALGASISITINGEQVTIDVNDNSFLYRYKDAISSLTFDGADVVSVNFADADSLDNITSCDDMFKNCAELVAVDFGGKKMSAVLSATDMFDGCTSLTTLICPDTSTWKADLDFSDCPDLTTDSLYDLIKFLYVYDSGVHTITPNTAMWNALDSDVQDDLIAKAAERGWTIGVAARYTISGHSNGSTVYATINGESVEIEVVAGAFQYDYNTAITSISFENDTNLTDIDFTLSDGLAGVTSLNDAFKGCTALTSVVFTDCDLSNVASASDCFANCSALTNLTIPSDSWMPDVDFSTCPLITYAEMIDIINGLFTYTSGTHTITFNSTIWDAMSVADQQQVFDAADAKGWTTNAVAVVYVIRGTSTNVNGTETFNIQFIQDGALSPDIAETITCAVDGNGNFEYSYLRKKIYSLANFATSNSNVTALDFLSADDLTRCVYAQFAFAGCVNLASISFNQLFDSVIDAHQMFQNTISLTTVDLSSATFASLTNAYGMFQLSANVNNSYTNNIDLSSAIFGNVTDASYMFYKLNRLNVIDLSSATFAMADTARSMIDRCSALTSLDLSSATFANLTNAVAMVEFAGTSNMVLTMPEATFAKVTNCEGFGWNSYFKEIDFPKATFAECTNFVNMFTKSGNLQKINMPIATFAKAVNAANSHGVCKECNHLIEFLLPSATLQKIEYTLRFFESCSSLTTIDVPQNSTAISPASTAANAPMNLQFSPLTYASMLKVANWLSDLTGYSAHTCTFKASAWNALSSAEQTTIDGILSGKNWNRAIA